MVLTLEIEGIVREQTDRRINNAVGREMVVRRVLAVSTLLDIALAEGLAYLRELRAHGGRLRVDYSVRIALVV